MSESDWIFEELRSGMKALVERFIETPYFFYSEQDMHAYHKLISGRLGESLIQTHFGDRTVLVHREYPTLRAYPDRRGGKRGHFDLAILDPAHASESHWRTQARENKRRRSSLQ